MTSLTILALIFWRNPLFEAGVLANQIHSRTVIIDSVDDERDLTLTNPYYFILFHQNFEISDINEIQ